MENKKNRIGDFKNFSEAMRTKDLSSIPGKIPGEEDYIGKVTDRAKTRLGIQREREGNAGKLINIKNKFKSKSGPYRNRWQTAIEI